MDPRAFLATAEYLVDVAEDDSELAKDHLEADYRTAISRAYYACFNTCKLLIERMTASRFTQATCHGDVRTHLRNSGNSDLAAAAGTLASLHEDRKRADYEFGLNDRVSNDHAWVAMSRARRVVAVVDTIEGEPLYSQVRAAIRGFRNLPP